MTDPVPDTRRAPTAGGVLPDQWPTQVTDALVDVVGKVHDKTTKPALTAARAVVFGLAAAILGVAALVLFCVFAIRIVDNYLPGKIWIIYLALGFVFCLGGGILWSKAFGAPKADPAEA